MSKTLALINPSVPPSEYKVILICRAYSLDAHSYLPLTYSIKYLSFKRNIYYISSLVIYLIVGARLASLILLRKIKVDQA